MDKITMIGVGHGATEELYNTCFVVQNEQGDFLVDAGGSIEIIPRLRKLGIDYKMLKHIFISHSHTDHVLGLIWLFKRIGVAIMHGDIKEKINLYCNDVVCETIKVVSEHVLPEKLVKLLFENIIFHILNDGDKYLINGNQYTFWDMQAKGTKLFGFETKLNGKKLAFLGDETLNPALYERVEGFDYVMHEAFCLDSEEKKFKAYEKNHSTTKSVSELMNSLEVKNLILYHTEDTHKEKRKELYTNEAKDYFKGRVIVPDDLEEIEIK